MKKFSLVLALFISGTIGISQDFFYKIGTGISIFQEEHSFMTNYYNIPQEETEIDFEFAPNFVLQLGLNFELTKKLHIAPVIYPSFGLWSIVNTTNEMKFVYAVELPILAEFHIGNRERFHPFIGAGINYSYYSNSSYSGNYPGLFTNVETGPVSIYGPQFTFGLNYNLGFIDEFNKLAIAKNTWKISYTVPVNSPHSTPGLNFTKHEFLRNLTMSLLFGIG